MVKQLFGRRSKRYRQIDGLSPPPTNLPKDISHIVNIDNDLYEGALDVLERLRERFVVGTRIHFHELVEFQRGRCGDDMKCVRPDQEMRALYRFLRRHPCIGLALDPVRGGRPRAQPVVFVVARTECE